MNLVSFGYATTVFCFRLLCCVVGITLLLVHSCSFIAKLKKKKKKPCLLLFRFSGFSEILVTVSSSYLVCLLLRLPLVRFAFCAIFPYSCCIMLMYTTCWLACCLKWPLELADLGMITCILLWRFRVLSLCFTLSLSFRTRSRRTRRCRRWPISHQLRSSLRV